MSMTTNIVVVDNFYNNAEAVRKFILTQDFPVLGNYPGFRTTSCTNPSIKTHFEKLLNKEITLFDMSSTSYNGAFQYTTAGMKSWIHRDGTDWAGIVYLTPDAPPAAGTGFFRHKVTGLEEMGVDISDSDRALMNNDSNDISKWDMVDYVGNVYNRLVLFRGKRSHRSMAYFGNDKHDGRLFQLFFFNVGRDLPLASPEPTPPAIPPAVIPSPLNTTLKIPKCRVPASKDTKICVLFFTTSRYEYLEPMLASFHDKVDFGDMQVHKILIDDYPLARSEIRLKLLARQYSIDELIMNDENMGYSRSWDKAWSLVGEDVDYVFHQEEDFVFAGRVVVADMIDCIFSCPITLSQVVLKRQPWFETSDFIDKINRGEVGEGMSFPSRDTQGTLDPARVHKVVVQRGYFLSNPCIYPRWVLDVECKHHPQEPVVVEALNAIMDPLIYGAIYGTVSDPPKIRHIGHYTHGKKVAPDEPGWSYLQHYDPEKKYDSRGYLKEWDESPIKE